MAAQATVEYFEQVRMAAEASAELAGRMARVGNFSKLAHMREQAFYADATARLAKSRHQAVVERERLDEVAGRDRCGGSIRAAGTAPRPARCAARAVAIEQAALDRRLDMQLARSDTAGVAADLGLVRATRFINVLEAGYTNESETGERRKSGYEIEVAIPLFDWGDAKLKRAEAVYMQSVERTAQVALAARSEVRERYHGYRMAFDVARHYRDEIVPLRKRIAEENTLRYNGMLIGVFELIADARDQVASVNASSGSAPRVLACRDRARPRVERCPAKRRDADAQSRHADRRFRRRPLNQGDRHGSTPFFHARFRAARGRGRQPAEPCIASRTGDHRQGHDAGPAAFRPTAVPTTPSSR